MGGVDGEEEGEEDDAGEGKAGRSAAQWRQRNDRMGAKGARRTALKERPTGPPPMPPGLPCI